MVAITWERSEMAKKIEKEINPHLIVGGLCYCTNICIHSFLKIVINVTNKLFWVPT